jgi:hypothetical protein
MSMRCASFTTYRRRTWGRLFGGFIRGRREKLGLTVADAARLAGMEFSEWAVRCRPRWPGSVRWQPPSNWTGVPWPAWWCSAGEPGSNHHRRAGGSDLWPFYS